MMRFLFDVRSALRHRVRRVAFQKQKSCLYFSYFLFQWESVYLLFFFQTVKNCDFVAHKEHVGHTSGASGPSEWKALHRFAPLTVCQITFAYFNEELHPGVVQPIGILLKFGDLFYLRINLTLFC